MPKIGYIFAGKGLFKEAKEEKMGEIHQIASVPIITTLVYGAMVLLKYTFEKKEGIVRLIPVFAVLFGCILGISVYYVAPELIVASNVFSAILVGGASGLAATGTHQVFKQLQKTDNSADSNILESENSPEGTETSLESEDSSDSQISKSNSLEIDDSMEIDLENSTTQLDET